ncbi:MAG: hypothetical protein ACOYIK_10895, partial [Coriobacteriales bacterium]
PQCFYNVRAGVKGTKMVTARGWEDLSRIMRAYEMLGREVNVELVSQYIQDDTIAEDFSIYYSLYSKYSDDYKVDEILAGSAPEQIRERATMATADERVALAGLLADSIESKVHQVMAQEEALRLVRGDISENKLNIVLSSSPVEDFAMIVDEVIDKAAPPEWSPDMGDSRTVLEQRGHLLKEIRSCLNSSAATGDVACSGKEAFDVIRGCFNSLCGDLEPRCEAAGTAIDNGISFLDDLFGQDRETMVLMSRLSNDPVVVKFVGEHGSEEFIEHNRSLLLDERGLDLLERAKALGYHGVEEIPE